MATIIVQIVGPTLLAIGLRVRPISLLMLLLTLLAQNSGPPQDEHLFWAVLFGWYVSQGAGPLSLDHLLAKGLGLSPLPFAGEPWRRPIGSIGMSAHYIASSCGFGSLRPWSAPALRRRCCPRWDWVRCRVPERDRRDDAGSGNRHPARRGFIAARRFERDYDGPRSRSCRSTACCFSRCWALRRRTIFAGPSIGRRICRQGSLPDDAPHIVIVGAGFGGMACAAGLRHAPARVTLMDRRNYHLFQPLLYQVATGSLSPADIATPVRDVFREDTSCAYCAARLRRGRRGALHHGGRPGLATTARARDRRQPRYFGNEQWAEYAPGLKSIEDATGIRAEYWLLSSGPSERRPSDRATLLTFLVCGAGPTGVELAGAIAELSRNGMDKEFRRFHPASARILLVQAGPRVLPQFGERLSAFASVARGSGRGGAGGQPGGGDRRGRSRRERRAHRRRHGALGRRRGCFSGRGMAGREAGRGRGSESPDLSVPGLPDVFAIGDTALAIAWMARGPGLAPAAKQGGAYVASVLRARLRGGRPPPPFRYRHQGSLATIGRKSAIAEFGRMKLTGALGGGFGAPCTSCSCSASNGLR